MTSALRILHEGFWLGLLDRRQLHEVTRRQYLEWPHYRAAEFNLGGLEAWEARAVEEHFRQCGSIVVGSAGGGREAVALARLGHRVTAFECIPELADACRSLIDSEGLDVEVLNAEPDSVPEGLGVHDGAVVGWGAYMHIPGRAARVDFLRQLRRRIRPGGPLLVSFFARRGSGRALRWKAALARAVRRMRLSSEGVEMGDTLERTFDHWFDDDEIRSELEEAGFEPAFSAATPYGHAVGIAGSAPRDQRP